MGQHVVFEVSFWWQGREDGSHAVREGRRSERERCRVAGGYRAVKRWDDEKAGEYFMCFLYEKNKTKELTICKF